MLSDAECAHRYRQLVAFARDADQAPNDPNRALGGPGSSSWRRSPLPVGWSTIKPVPAAPGKTVGATIEPIVSEVLAMQGSGGAAQVWTVLASGRLSATSPLDLDGRCWLRLTWTMGGVVRTADVDLPARGVCLPIVADSIKIQAVNQSGFPFDVDAAVSPYCHTSDYRAPRRTVVVTLGTATPQLVSIPQFAQQVTIFGGNASVSGVNGGVLTFRASSGFSYGEFPFFFQGPVLMDIPGNAIEISVPAFAAATGSPRLSFVFRLGF